MGHTLAAWQGKVADLILDAGGVDLTPAQILTVGIAPALARFSVDRPRSIAAEIAGAGSAYLELPTGWSPGFSTLTRVEYPARQNPPVRLDSQSWQVTRSVADVEVEQLLLGQAPAVGEYVRVYFTGGWPLPTGDADIDQVDDLAFEAVSALAASFCCISLAGEASRSRAGALPSDFSDGSERGRMLMDAARMYRASYDSFIGIGLDGDGGRELDEDVSRFAPAAGSFDLDPSSGSLFHGGRR